MHAGCVMKQRSFTFIEQAVMEVNRQLYLPSRHLYWVKAEQIS